MDFVVRPRLLKYILIEYKGAFYRTRAVRAFFKKAKRVHDIFLEGWGLATLRQNNVGFAKGKNIRISVLILLNLGKIKAARRTRECVVLYVVAK